MGSVLVIGGGAAGMFAAITAALCLLLNFLLVDDLHAYSRVTLGEYYAQADAVDTVFVGSSHSLSLIHI